MAGSRLEFSDLNTNMGADKKGAGCYVSGAAGAGITLMAVLLSVGVGLIVHLAEHDTDLVCTIHGGDAPSTDALTQQCQILAGTGNVDVCGQCPAPPATPTPAPGATTPPAAPAKVKDVRLPGDWVPVHYDLWIQPFMQGDPEAFHFDGIVTIHLQCLSPTDHVTLHINDLHVDLTSVIFSSLDRDSAAPIFEGTVHYDTDRQFIIFMLDKKTTAGSNYTLHMNYTAPLRNDLKGLYFSTFTRNGETKYMATTQMEPTQARKTLPCMDEPALKATFNVTLVRPDYLRTLSNMDILDSSLKWTSLGTTWVADVYQQSPRMATYLLAFIFCDYDSLDGKTTNNVTFRTWASPESVNQTAFALDLGTKALQFFDDYFQVKYPLPKQDMIAIPDFEEGAMENWGLITYRETRVLFKDGVSSEANKEDIATTVTHELSHMWFGDLVTMAWWDDLWLNEGFAEFMMTLGVNDIHPDWKLFEKFLVDNVHKALSFDGGVTSHPLYVPVYSPDEIGAIFDTISYNKGASVIRMMQHFLGPDTFRQGLTRYLKNRSYANARHDDLWAAMTEQATLDKKTIDVKAIMDTWLLQMNYPVVTVARDFNDPEVLHVTQERYLVDRQAEDPEKYTTPFGYRWTIPLTFTSHRLPNFNQTSDDITWMQKEEIRKTIHIGANNLPNASDSMGWFLANVGEHGYYRVNYPEGNWKALIKQLKADHNIISVVNRAQIINDAWSLAKAGYLSLDTALSTTDYLDQERDYVPWQAAKVELTFVNDMLTFSTLHGAFNKFMQTKLKAPYKELGMNNTGATHSVSYIRSLIATQACKYGVTDCLKEANRLYKLWMSSGTKVDPNLKSAIYCYGIQAGGWDEWSFAFQTFKNETVAAEQEMLMDALACSKEPWILNYYLSLILEEDSPIRGQDVADVIRAVSTTTPEGRLLAWKFLTENIGYMHDRFGTNGPWRRRLSIILSSRNTPRELEEITMLEAAIPDITGYESQAIQQAKEKVASNIKWMQRNTPVLQKFFKTNNYL